jgi:succinate dehydrogenase / fumarate reductase cytochrome b subunit
MERPTSPHLTIYKWQITMVLSITHRFTGVALYAGALAMVVWLVISAYFPAHYTDWYRYAISPVGRVMFLGWTLSFYYHLANGIRHLFWDMGKGYTLKVATISGWAVVFFTLAATAASWGYIADKTGVL